MLIESLELRQLMSVSVHQLPNGGVLVKGTNGNDAVTVGQQGDQLFVQDGTYDPNAGGFNAVGDPVVVNSGVKYVVVDLGNGNDYVQFIGQDSVALISTGNGNDLADVTALGTQSVVVDTGNSDDTAIINALDNSNVVAFAGNGNDTASIIVTQQAHVYYDAGPGTDQTTIDNTGAACQVIYNSGPGADVTVLANGSDAFIGG